MHGFQGSRESPESRLCEGQKIGCVKQLRPTRSPLFELNCSVNNLDTKDSSSNCQQNPADALNKLRRCPQVAIRAVNIAELAFVSA